ncbi:MAG: protein phosphatase 2C domain-containing protein [Bacteroidota bacterium]
MKSQNQAPEWAIAAGSVPGASHLAAGGVGCQDANWIERLRNGWVLGILADGAGSYSQSGLGAQFAVSTSAKYAKQLIYRKNWHKRTRLPHDLTWRKQATFLLRQIRSDLRAFAEDHNVGLEELSCTIIVMIATPFGAMLAHIGDGRAAVKTANEGWIAAMRPFNGLRHETVFITSPWEENPMRFLRTNVIHHPIKGFMLCSDGGASASFRIAAASEYGGEIFDPNQPYAPFLDPICQQLLGLRGQRKSQSMINTLWKGFLKNGNDALAYEPDDKTIIIGALS